MRTKALLGLLLVAAHAGEVLGEPRQEPLGGRRGDERGEPAATKQTSLMSQLTWIVGSEDVLGAGGSATPPSSAPAFGERLPYGLAGDRLQVRRGARDNWLLLSSQAWFQGYVPKLTTAAVLALAFDLLAVGREPGASLPVEDVGTHVAIQYATSPASRLSLDAFPLNADEIRLGYLYALSYGGTDARRGESVFPRSIGPLPGLRVSHRSPGHAAFVAVKTAEIPEPLASGTGTAASATEANYGVLVGIEARPWARWSLALEGAYFEHGRFPMPELAAARAYTLGAALRVAVSESMLPEDALAPAFDFGGFPSEGLELGVRAPGQAGPGWLVALETTALLSRLRVFEGSGATRLEPARALALQAKLREGSLRTGLIATLSEPAFELRYGPSLVPFQTLPSSVGLEPRALVVASAALSIGDDEWRPGMDVAIERPAGISSVTSEGFRTLALGRLGEGAILAPNQGLLPVLHARASLRWAASPGLVALGWTQYRRDPNAAELSPNQDGDYRLEKPMLRDSLGFGLALQSRF